MVCFLEVKCGVWVWLCSTGQMLNNDDLGFFLLWHLVVDWFVQQLSKTKLNLSALKWIRYSPPIFVLLYIFDIRYSPPFFNAYIQYSLAFIFILLYWLFFFYSIGSKEGRGEERRRKISMEGRKGEKERKFSLLDLIKWKLK